MDRGALKESAAKQRLQGPAEPSSLGRELALRRLELEFVLEVKKMEHERMERDKDRDRAAEMERLDREKVAEMERFERVRRQPRWKR